ncbi:hypothetical protein AB0368_06450 [Actinoplanes sp. NPDC051475]|uniref:hypothetical protein n=1 Tax=Actinoplanes sp. NPDC051475 TaxID=3157225 RepID=UPI00344D9180
MPLKRIRSDVERRLLDHSRLWLDDLQQIVRIVREAAAPNDVKILIDGEYEADEVSDLTAYPKSRVRAVLISADEAGVEIILSDREAALTMHDPNLTLRGMATEIQRITSKRRRWLNQPRAYWQLPTLALGLLAAMVAVAGLQEVTGPHSTPSAREIMVALISAGVAVGAFLLALLPGRGRSSAYVMTRPRKASYLLRNADNLTSNVIVSAIFLILGIVIGLLF